MESLPVDNMECEKSKVFRNCRRQQKLKQVMRVFNIFLALFLFCRSSLLPIIIDFGSLFYRETMSLLSNYVYVFIIGNAIIVFIYILTIQDGNHDANVSNVVHHPYFCEDRHFANMDDCDKSGPESNTLLKNVSEVVLPEPSNNQIVLVEFPPERQGGSFSDKCLKEDSTAETETETPKVGMAQSRDVKNKFTETKVKRSYKRVQSENYERQGVVKPGRGQLQRMGTENQSQSQLVRYSNGPRSNTQRRLRCVEDLSNEEFNPLLIMTTIMAPIVNTDPKTEYLTAKVKNRDWESRTSSADRIQKERFLVID